jgi:hypothetical protein
MQTIYLAGQRYDLPGTWAEVPADRLPKLLELLFVKPEGGETYHELLRTTLGLSKRAWTKMACHYFSPHLPPGTRRRNAETLAQVLGLIEWMWRDELTRQPFAAVRAGGRDYLLPDEQLRTVAFGELTDAYIHAQAFIKQLEPGEGRLHLLLATLCRPERSNPVLGPAYTASPDWNGDRREPYNEHAVRHRADAMAALEPREKVAVLMYFLGSLKEFLATYDTFDADTPEGSVYEDDYPGQGFIKNQHLLAEKGVFGTLKQTKEANAHEVFLFLEEHKKDLDAQIEAEERAQDARRHHHN